MTVELKKKAKVMSLRASIDDDVSATLLACSVEIERLQQEHKQAKSDAEVLSSVLAKTLYHATNGRMSKPYIDISQIESVIDEAQQEARINWLKDEIEALDMSDRPIEPPYCDCDPEQWAAIAEWEGERADELKVFVDNHSDKKLVSTIEKEVIDSVSIMLKPHMAGVFAVIREKLNQEQKQ